MIWIDIWREKVQEMSIALDRFRSYAEGEGNANRKAYHSPEFVTKFLPLIFAIVWVVGWIGMLVVWLGIFE